ncbi:MAG: fumarylacetoacetase [Armatimonadetes bacterium]|nr:fumarylacetoacetase [Armatimonadota bacterium]
MKFVIPEDKKSWVPVPEGSGFPIQNLPFGKFIDPATGLDELGVRIGDLVLSLRPLAEAGLIEDLDLDMVFDVAGLAEAVGGSLAPIRRRVYELLEEGSAELQGNAGLRRACFLPADGLEMVLPTFVRGFVDFYSGIHHASNVGRMFRPDQPPLLPNYRHLPVAYNGRASSVIVSGEPILRPNGQTKDASSESPTFGPTKELDFELEMGFLVGKGNDLGSPIPIEHAEDHVLGLVLVNDWSARDVQRWEYQPLGPFLAKSFATSISPWVVTLDALEPFRIAGMPQNPEVLPHLRQSGSGHFDIQLEVTLQSKKMAQPQVICRSNTSNLYWTIAQQIAHMASNGANLEPGDLCASGTISGPGEDSYGSMLELSWRGQRPIQLSETGETRTFLEDGDTVAMTAFARKGGLRIEFGEVRGTVGPAAKH